MVTAAKQLQTAATELSHPPEGKAEVWWVRGSGSSLIGVNRHSRDPNPSLSYLVGGGPDLVDLSILHRALGLGWDWQMLVQPFLELPKAMS